MVEGFRVASGKVRLLLKEMLHDAKSLQRSM